MATWKARFRLHVCTVHRPVAGAVLPAVNVQTKGVPDRWCTCVERSSL